MERLRPKVRKALEKDGRSLYEIEIDVDDIGQAIKEVLTEAPTECTPNLLGFR